MPTAEKHLRAAVEAGVNEKLDPVMDKLLKRTNPDKLMKFEE